MTTAAMLAWALGAIPLAIYLIGVWRVLRVKISSGMNSADFATETFIDLVRSAEKQILICDDGDDDESSIYANTRVVDAIEKQLAKHEQLNIVCLFSSEDETAFTDRFGTHDRVHIKSGAKPRQNIHFKIVDGGRKGYVSAHPFRSVERRYKLYDCPDTWWGLDFMRQAAFGRHIQTMKNAFLNDEGVKIA